MGFELTQSAVFYLILMVVVIFIGLAIVAKGNPLNLIKQQEIAGLFEPGRMISKNAIGESVGIICGLNNKVTITDADFVYRGKSGDKRGNIEFIVLLDYGRIFRGMNADGSDVQKISCEPVESEDFSDCPPVSMEFSLPGPLDPKTNQTFHFTVWKANQALKDAAAPDSNPSFGRLLDTYSNYYVSSFDVSKNVDEACQKSKCLDASDKNSCAGTAGCYWGGWDTCQVCPRYGECDKYSVTQCTACPAPLANCKAGLSINPLTGFSGCQPK